VIVQEGTGGCPDNCLIMGMRIAPSSFVDDLMDASCQRCRFEVRIRCVLAPEVLPVTFGRVPTAALVSLWVFGAVQEEVLPLQ